MNYFPNQGIRDLHLPPMAKVQGSNTLKRLKKKKIIFPTQQTITEGTHFPSKVCPQSYYTSEMAQ